MQKTMGRPALHEEIVKLMLLTSNENESQENGKMEIDHSEPPVLVTAKEANQEL